MSNRRRIQRQPCNLEARIFIPGSKTVIPCTITDISTHGSFITTPEHELVPPNFDLSIGMSILPRACRIARREANGFGVEFLEPVRHEVEEILIEHVFKEELIFELFNPALDGAETITGVRLRQTVNAIMNLIERRNAMVWQHTTAHETSNGSARFSAPPMPMRYSHKPLKELLRSA
ncbi:PilZ domain-containing protein [Methylobacterium sp. E-041]|uniref:PilZ domain-containing protein n=1 Tax=Methylobacterium sp. E-041 TaxID=2836573 RepID=UPI001FB8B97C|nr:PilZ domain-containing protein [Methylobacterium sp. E-041]MCJ2108171.1 PilZ domain-containing protein [Methylobacterium sp. E-041]